MPPETDRTAARTLFPMRVAVTFALGPDPATAGIRRPASTPSEPMGWQVYCGKTVATVALPEALLAVSAGAW